ncbi:putative protein YqbD [subsurface metagenome]
MDFELNTNFIEKNSEKRLVFCVVYEPDVKDEHGDWATAEDIEKAAHEFLTDHRNIGIMHQQQPKELKLVESWIAPLTFEWNGQVVQKGSWIVAIHIDDAEIWQAIKEGILTGVSMQGYAAA